MTQPSKSPTCQSTTALSDNEAADTLIAAGLAASPDEAIAQLRGWYGRKMCANPGCHGAVLKTTKGIRKHVIGSNLTDAERVALIGPEPTWKTEYPKQVGDAKLQPLTPELIAHYS